jgi:hypothetical protein
MTAVISIIHRLGALLSLTAVGRAGRVLRIHLSSLRNTSNHLSSPFPILGRTRNSMVLSESCVVGSFGDASGSLRSVALRYGSTQMDGAEADSPANGGGALANRRDRNSRRRRQSDGDVLFARGGWFVDSYRLGGVLIGGWEELGDSRLVVWGGRGREPTMVRLRVRCDAETRRAMMIRFDLTGALPRMRNDSRSRVCEPTRKAPDGAISGVGMRLECLGSYESTNVPVCGEERNP